MNFATKLATLAATATASFLAPRLVSSGWKVITGHEPPDDADQSHLSQILLFTAVSAVASTLLTQLALRGADRVAAHPRHQRKEAKTQKA